ncbi:MAG: hypothetical protein Q9213_001257 [Squamulea squamosa]
MNGPPSKGVAVRIDDGAHFVERKILDFQRASAKGYVCPYCNEAFVQEPKLWDHAKKFHRDSLNPAQGPDEGHLRKQLRAQAAERASNATRKTIRDGGHPVPIPLLAEHNPPGSDISHEVGPGSPPMSVSTPGLGHNDNQAGTPRRIDDFGKLTLGQGPSPREGCDSLPDTFSMSNPLKRGPTESLEAQQIDSKSQSKGHISSARRREKTHSSGSPIVLDPDFTRGEKSIARGTNQYRNSYSSMYRMYSPYGDDTYHGAITAKNCPPLEKASDIGLPRAPSTHEPSPDEMALDEQYVAIRPPNARQLAIGQKDPSNRSQRGPSSLAVGQDIFETQPQMLLQPETRPISHAQLVVEVKGIYHGLVMVEQKCIEIDGKQSAAALERDPTKRTDLKDEQWQALIALHKTLLHEHHDFFLASQHPSASPPLSKLASRYTMPARMWRHGIHAFLEVLRHRLPASLDHMLAFIYIAYSMVALLYETVTTFEDTWIECLGDLGRYRMAIEDSSSSDREIWGGVARSWYNKAADKRPGVGRLYHHLAILARPFSLSQLAYYTRALSSPEPFDSARSSIMTLFQPVLDGKTFNHHRVKALEIAYIKAHGVLFDRPQEEEVFLEILASIRNGLLDGYMDRITSNFKEQGLYIATSNISAVFEYGGPGRSKLHRPLVWQAFMDVKTYREELAVSDDQKSTDAPFSLDGDSKPASPNSPLSGITSSVATTADPQASSFLRKASDLAFTTLSITLRRDGDKNVFPFVHCMFVFLWNLANIESIMKYFQADIPWSDICSFLNTLAKPEIMTTAVLDSDALPQSSENVERPLPEDFFMRGQLFALDYLPIGWCEDNMVDEEERMLELPSMTATRIERLLWLGIRMAKMNKWIYYDTVVHTFRPIPDGSDK